MVIETSMKKQEALSIPNPHENPREESRVSYSLYYRINEEHDSPYKSRKSLVQRLYPHALTLSYNSWILDIGSGRQAVEEEYNAYTRQQLQKGLPVTQCRIATLDIADLNQDQLVGNGIPHVQASGDKLPFPDGIFPIVISNMAFDFMPSESKQELYRVLTPGGRVFLNLHHPSLISPDLYYLLNMQRRKIKNKMSFGKSVTIQDQLTMDGLLYRDYLRANGILYSSPEAIRNDFERYGFLVESVNLKNDTRKNKWWEVEMRKS